MLCWNRMVLSSDYIFFPHFWFHSKVQKIPDCSLHLLLFLLDTKSVVCFGFSSFISVIVVVQSPSHVWLCNPMGWSMPALPVPHHLPKFPQVHFHCISDAIQPSHALNTLFSFCLQSLPASGNFPMSWLFALFDQNTGASASASVLSVSIQGWFP